MSRFAPRDRAVAARWLQVALLVAAAVVSGMTFTTSGTVALLACLAAAVCCASGVVAIWRGWQPGARAWTLVLVTATALLVASNIATADASVTGIVFFLLAPVVASGALHSGAAWLAAALSSAGALVNLAALVPLGEALSTWGYISVLIGFTVVLLTRTVDSNDRLLEELRRQAAIDPLTGLVTRRVLDDALSTALAGRSGERGVCLVVVDLDHFKSVNDRYGHPVGDAALVQVAGIMTRCGGPGAVACRLGGDEFALLLPVTGLDDAVVRAQAMVRQLRAEPLHLADGAVVPLTMSVGVACSAEHGLDVAALYRSADAALYEAKRAGRDDVAVFTEALLSAAPAAPRE